MPYPYTMKQLPFLLIALMVLFGCAPVGYNEGVVREQRPQPTATPHLKTVQMDVGGRQLQFEIPTNADVEILPCGEDHCKHKPETIVARPPCKGASFCKSIVAKYHVGGVRIYQFSDKGFSSPEEWVNRHTSGHEGVCADCPIMARFFATNTSPFDLKLLDDVNAIRVVDHPPSGDYRFGYERTFMFFDYNNHIVQIGMMGKSRGTQSLYDEDIAFTFNTIVDTIRVAE